MKARNSLVLIFSVMSLFSSLAGIAQPHSLPTPDHPQLEIFAKPNQFIWLDDFKLTAQAQDALSFIKAAAIHGLDPEDYHFSLLQQLSTQTNIEHGIS